MMTLPEVLSILALWLVVATIAIMLVGGCAVPLR